MEPSVPRGDDVVGVSLPDEGLRFVGVVFANEAVDGCLEIDHRVEDAVLEPTVTGLAAQSLDSC